MGIPLFCQNSVVMGMIALDPPSDRLSGEKLARSRCSTTRVRDLEAFYAPKKGKNG